MLHLSRELNWNWEDFISLAGQDRLLEQKNKPSDLTLIIASRIFQNVQDILIGEDSLSALLELKRKINRVEQEPLGLKGKALLLNEVLRALKQKTSPTFRHPKELIKDVDDVLKPLLKAKAKEERAASQKGKGEIGKSSSHLAYKTIDQLNQLPLELLLAIFQQLSSEDFGLTACVSKLFYDVSHISQTDTFSKQVPSYISQSTDPRIQQMPPWKQMQLARHIHNRLLSDQPLHLVFEKYEHSSHLFIANSFPKAIIQNYFVLSTEPGSVQIYDLKTGQEKYFCLNATKQPITACVAIRTSRPLAAIFTMQGFQIWDLDQVMQEDEAKAIFEQVGDSDDADSQLAKSEIYDSDWKLHSGTIFPVTTSHKGLLGVGYTNHVKLFDCAQPGFPSLKIEFQNVIQIQLTDEALMLVSENDLAIWNLEVVTQAFANGQSLKLDSALVVKPCEPALIKLAKMWKDKLVIAYREFYDEGENSGWHIGEVRNWKTNQLLRSLVLSSRFLETLDLNIRESLQIDLTTLIFLKDSLITGSNSIWRWSLKPTNSNQVILSISDNWTTSVHKIYALDSENILIANRNHLTLANLKQENLSLTQIRNERIDFHPDSYNECLISCELNGSWLILQTQYRRWGGGSLVKIYDLNHQESNTKTYISRE